MPTTTIRVDTETHQELVALSRVKGTSLLQTVRDAAEALHRQQFAHQVVEELAQLHSDTKEWQAYLTDSESTTVADGIR